MGQRVSVLGTGIMGAGMARNLLKAGMDVTVWNRGAEKARPLAEAGARVAEDPASAVSAAEVVLTMLFDLDAVSQVMEQALTAAPDGLIWAQTSTVGLEGTERLAELAHRHHVVLVDAPVLGTRQPAEEGRLVVLAAGPTEAREKLAPVFEAIGSRTVWAGSRPGDGHRLKLAANSWVLTLVGGTAQAIALAEGLGVDPTLFLDCISGGPLDCDYAQLKGKAMVSGAFPPAFTLGGAVKDSALIADAMRAAGTDDTLMSVLHQQFVAAARAGHEAEDMAAIWYAARKLAEPGQGQD
jgi:3-hydroxyisobutyrate dehydrogenase